MAKTDHFVNFGFGSRRPLLLLLVCLLFTSTTCVVQIDPLLGNDSNWPTGTIKSFAPLCGQTLLAFPDVVIASRVEAATVTVRCNISTVSSITCAERPCFIDFGLTGQLIVSGRVSTPMLPISNVTLISDFYNSLPLFWITGNTTIKMDNASAQFWIRRPLIYAGPGSTFQMRGPSSLTFQNTPETAADIMKAENATITVRDFFFADSVIHNASIFSISASSYLDVSQTDWNNTVLRQTSTFPCNLIYSVDSTVVIDTLAMRYTSVFASMDTLHPSLISIRQGYLSASYATILTTSFFTSGSRYGSVISIVNAVYSVFHADMRFSTSPGCNYVFASGSSGEIDASFFWKGNITGTPAENVANGTRYPPFEIPTVASVICLVKGLDDLRNDFGWPRRNPLSPLNYHRFRADFSGNTFTSRDASLNRKVMNSANIHLLYATDIWASNVRLEFIGFNSRDTSSVSVPSIRTDGCIVLFGGPTFQTCGWVDFGSHSFHSPGLTTVIHRSLGLYGAAPGNTSIIDSSAAVRMEFHITGDAPSSIITGGDFRNINVRFSHGLLTIGSVYSESILLSPPEPVPFVDILRIEYKFYIDSGEVVLARTVSPFIVNMLDITGTLTVPRLASPLAINPKPAEIQGDILLRGTLDLTDLNVTGYFVADSSGSFPSINIRISTSKNIFHGLDVIGDFNTPIQSIFVPNLQLLFDPAYSPLPNLSLSEEYPIPFLRVTGSAIGMGPSQQFADGNVFSTDTPIVDAQGRTVYSFHWKVINALSYYHPSAAGVVFVVPPNFVEMVTRQGYSQHVYCYGLFDTTSFSCRPLSPTTILAVTLDNSPLTLTPTTATSFLSVTPSSRYPADAEPAVSPTIYIKAIETEFINEPNFLIDAIYSAGTSMSLPSSQAFGIMWSYYSTQPTSALDSYMTTLSPNSWQLFVPSSNLVFDVDYRFTATLQRPTWLPIATVQGEITVRRSSKPANTFCQAPSFHIDAPVDTSIYPDTRPLFRIAYDTACPPPMAKVNIVWTLKGPGVFVTESLVGSIYVLPFLPKSLPFGTKLTLNATAHYDGDSNFASSQIQLTYKPYEPNVYYGGEFDRTATVGMVDITPTIQPAIGTISQGYNSRLCPITAFETSSQDLYADLSPFGATDAVCRFNDSSKAAYKMSIESRDQRLLVSPTSEWGAGDHQFSVSTTIDVFGDYKFSIPLSVVIRKSQDGYTPKVVIQLYNDTLARQYPHQLRQSSDSIALVALLSNGSLCIGCHYDWKVLEPVDYVIESTNSSVFFLPSVGIIAPGANVAVSVKVSYSTGLSYTTIEGRIQLKNGFYAFGGKRFSIVNGNKYSNFLTGWESIYAPLQYMHVAVCEDQYRIVRYIGTSYFAQFYPPRHRCSSSSSYSFKTLIVDRLGTLVSVGLSAPPVFPTAPVSWSQSLLLEYASNFSKSVEAHDIDSVVGYLNDLSALADADPNDWNNTKSQVAPTIISSLEKLVNVPYVDLMVCHQFSNQSLMMLLKGNDLTSAVLKTCLKAPSPGLSSFSQTRFRKALAVIAVLQSQYFYFRNTIEERQIQTSNWFDSIPNTRQLWSRVRDIMKPGLTVSHAEYIDLVSVVGLMLDIQSVQPGEVSCGSISSAVSFSLSSGLVQALKPTDSVLSSVVSMFFPRALHPMVSVDRTLSPLGSATVTFIENLNPNVDGYLKVSFVAPDPGSPVSCVSFQGESGSWLPNCNTVRDGLNLTCTCPVSGKLAGQISVSTLNLGLYCSSLPPQGGSFLCQNGTWVSIGSIDVPIVIIDQTTPVVTIIGNLTTDTIIFNGLQSVINVTGCTKIGTSITISLSIEEFEALIKSGQASDLLITSSGCDISNLGAVPIVTVIPEGRCEKVTTTSQSTSSSLSAVFSIDRSGCKKGSKTWWIVLVSVFGGIIVLAAIFAILATVTPLKHYVRPYTRRAEQASNTYYVEK